jgi:hypothetical protein
MPAYSFADVTADKGTVIVFICNHCSYVKAVIDRLVANPRVLMAVAIGFAAICSNDATDYSEGLICQYEAVCCGA